MTPLVSRVDLVGESTAMAHVDRCLDDYLSGCRARIPQFVERHFSLQETWRTQRPTLWVDLMLGPVNALWSVPYLVIKRLCDGLDMLGVTAAKRLLGGVPSGIKTGYERAIEAAIVREVLDWDMEVGRGRFPASLLTALQRHPALRTAATVSALDVAPRIDHELRRFLAGRALVSSSAGTALTVAGGWLAFGTISMELSQVADRIARSGARSRAASRFFLGRRAGGVFYSVFRPHASAGETMAILFVLALALAVAGMVCTLASDPIRKTLGLHERRLEILVDVLERELSVWVRKVVKPQLVDDRTPSGDSKS